MSISNSVEAKMTGVDITSLQTVLLAVLIAHRASCGCKPSQDQIDYIAYTSGAALRAVTQAYNAATQTYAEAQH